MKIRVSSFGARQTRRLCNGVRSRFPRNSGIDMGSLSKAKWKEYRHRSRRKERTLNDSLIGAFACIRTDRALARDRGLFRDYRSGLRLSGARSAFQRVRPRAWGFREGGLQATLAPTDSAAAALALERAAPGIERRRTYHGGQARRSFPGLADLERAPGQFLAVEGLDGSGSFLLRLEFHEGETARPAGGSVERQDHIRDGSHLAE